MRLDIVASGMVTAVGFDAESSCAALRVGIDGFTQSRFQFDGEFIRAGIVSAPEDIRGLEKLAWMAASAIDQCLAVVHPEHGPHTALALCLAEESRPGRLRGLDERFLARVCARLAMSDRLAGQRKVSVSGSLGAVESLVWAEKLFAQGAASHCIVVGVDSYLHGATLDAFHAARRLLTARNADGFMPGEAAAAILLSRTGVPRISVECLGIGWGREVATQDSERPLRADGLTQAYREALAAAGCGFERIDYRLADISGDQYSFKEAALALLRTMRVRKEAFTIWHPADCVGRVGAAAVPLILGVALAAARKSYAPGPGALCHFTDDSGMRAAAVLRKRDNVLQV